MMLKHEIRMLKIHLATEQQQKNIIANVLKLINTLKWKVTVF